MSRRLDGKRVLVTHADRYMGPPIVERFRDEGADVVADETDYTTGPDVAAEVVAAAGQIDVLVANFAGPRERMPVTSMISDVTEFEDAEFQDYLDELVWPLLRVVRAGLPQMIERKSGKIVVAASATPVRAIPGLAVYSAARGAQNAFVQVVGAEAAPHNVQVNGFGPAHIRNNMYYTDEMLADDAVRESFESQIPAGRMGRGADAAALALALATDASDFLADRSSRSPVDGPPEHAVGVRCRAPRTLVRHGGTGRQGAGRRPDRRRDGRRRRRACAAGRAGAPRGVARRAGGARP